MNRKSQALILFLSAFCLPPFCLTGCGGGSSSSSASPAVTPTAVVVGITATTGSAQSAAVGQPFAGPFEATVTTNSVRIAGQKVTFTAPASGASGTFANGTTTDVEITDTNGLAKSSAFTANATGGAYAVTATVSGAATPVSFSLTNIATTSYSFYVSGDEALSGSFYAVAGSVAIDSTGNVLGGEQDYNDGFGGIASREPAGDSITGGSLTFPSASPAGQGTLTLNTNNPNLGVAGVETFAVQFVNASHALIMQFDGTATSSGSMDLQTLPSTLSGGYAFAVSGYDSSDTPMAFGGVFSVSGTTLSNGVIDINDAENFGVTVATTLNGTISAPDAFGRGTIKGVKVAGSSLSLNYYIVNSKVIRIIDVNAFINAAAGSAFSQGTGTFSNASIGPSVFTVAGNLFDLYGAIGQFTTSNTTSSPADFAGVGEDSEPNNAVLSAKAAKISGTYSIGANGYGSLNFKLNGSNQGLGDVTALGIYMTDPALNLSDPNNPSGGGGALLVDLDDGSLTGIPLHGGIGFIVPQTDTATSSFTGNYVSGWQDLNFNFCGCEFDMIAQGNVTAGVLSLTGLVSDPFDTIGTTDITSAGDTFTGAPLADTKNPGRYSLVTNKDSLATFIDGATGPPFEVTIYQASGGQLFWLGYDLADVSLDGQNVYVSVGPLEQQGSLTGLPAASKQAGRVQLRRRK